jgi:hypothetical protein
MKKGLAGEEFGKPKAIASIAEQKTVQYKIDARERRADFLV